MASSDAPRLTDISVAYPAGLIVTKDGSLPNDPDKTNWVEQKGGLPPYIKQVAEDLHTERGMSTSNAIAAAINRIKVWSRGGGDTKPTTQAKAAAALAQWEAMKKDAGVAEVADEALIEGVAKGLNYMEKPHRFTPGPAGMCLFCSNSQKWHTQNRPKTPAEVEQEKKDRGIQDKHEDSLGSARMLTALPTEDDMMAAQMADQKKIMTADKISGGMLQDPNDPMAAAGGAMITDPKAKAALRKALVEVLAKKMAGGGGGGMDDAKPDRPMIEIQYDPKKKAGGISEPDRKQMADDGIAMEDGTFPIADEADLKLAFKYWGKATDPHETRDHIIARAYDLDLLDLLPQNLRDYDDNQQAAKKKTADADADAAAAPDDEMLKHGTKGQPGYALLHPMRVSGTDGPRTRAAKIRAMTRALAKWMAMDDQTDIGNKDSAAGSTSPRGPSASERSGRIMTKAAAYAVTKASEEKRYTLGPMYIPDRLDAHNEFTTADELQKAVWDYVRTGDRQIRLQHNVDIVAGECVEVLSWPTEITAQMALPGMGLAKSADVSFPAGTTYMGIVWEPWAWDWVKKGKISGLSMGGFAKRVTVDLGEEVAKSVVDDLTTDPDMLLTKYAPGQRRDANGQFAETPGAAASLTPTSLPAMQGIIGGQRTPDVPFVQTSRTVNPRTGKATTHLQYVPEASTMSSENAVRAEGSATVQAVMATLTGLGLTLDQFLASLKVSKHGQKSTAGYGLLHPGKGGRNISYDELHFSEEEIDAAAARFSVKGPQPKAGKKKGDSTLAPLTDAEYAAHVDQIQSTLDDYAMAGGSKNPLESTNSSHLANRADPTDPNSNYLPSRSRQQREIIGSLINDAITRGVPTNRKSWIAGGLPGAGKSSFIKDTEGQKRLGLIPDPNAKGQFSNALVLNPDDIKVEMAKRGMFPDIPGTDPLERVGFVHEESSEITSALAAVAQSMGMNVVWDITAHSASSVADRIKDLRDSGYNDTTYFLLDVSMKHSLDSAATRHRLGVERSRSGIDGEGEEEKAIYGGRYVPAFVTKSNASKSGNRSKMRDAYNDILTGTAETKGGKRIGLPYRTILVDNEGYQKKVLEDKVFSTSISGSSSR